MKASSVVSDRSVLSVGQRALIFIPSGSPRHAAVGYAFLAKLVNAARPVLV